MLIREFETNDLDRVMKIWLESNIKSHHFIDESYWQGNYDLVKDLLLKSPVYIYQECKTIVGFVGLVDSYIGGIFVDANNQSKGIGKALLDYIKNQHKELNLQVYKKNSRAIDFYKRERFLVVKEQIDTNTNEKELVMNWSK